MILNIKKTSSFLTYMFLFYIFIGPSPFTVEGVAENANIEGGQDIFRQLFLLSVFFVFAAMYKIPLNLKNYTVFIVFVSYAFVSVFWSDYPFHSFRRVVLLCIVVAICIYIVNSHGVDLFKKLFDTLFFIQILNLIYLIFFPNLSFTELGFKGIHIQKNTLGVICVLSFILSLFHYERLSKFRFISMVFMSLIFLYLSESKTNLLLLAISTFFILLSYISLKLAREGLLFLFGVVIFSIGTIASLQSYIIPEYLQFISPDLLTGRGAIWRVLIESIEIRPLLGYGYGGFWGVGESSTVLYSDVGWLEKIGEGHNGFLDLLVNVGIVGLFIYLAILVSVLKCFWQDKQLKENIVIISLYLYVFLHNFTESSLVNVVQMVWVLFILTSLYVLRKNNHV